MVVPEKLRAVERAGGKRALARYLQSRVASGKSLDLPGYLVIGVGTSSRLKLPGCRVVDPAFRRHIDVVDGRMVNRDAAAPSATASPQTSPTQP